MPAVIPKWEEIQGFGQIVEKLVSRYPERFSGIDSQWLIAYGCVNKDKPKDTNKLPYDISGEPEPESFTNTKKYFFKVNMKDWEEKSSESKLAIVFAALSRIDRESPGSGKVLPLNYKDQDVMVRTFGPDWSIKSELPNLLTENVRIIDMPE